MKRFEQYLKIFKSIVTIDCYPGFIFSNSFEHFLVSELIFFANIRKNTCFGQLSGFKRMCGCAFSFLFVKYIYFYYLAQYVRACTNLGLLSAPQSL